jgi:O-antigen ligase
MLYLRPNDLLPIGTFPIVKIVGVMLLALFFVERLLQAGPLSVMPVELKHVLGITALMILAIPFAINSGEAWEGFTGEFVKVVLIFLVMINVVTSFRRLRRLLLLVVSCGSIVAFGTIQNFSRGQNLADGFRAKGWVAGMFGNPNDLALALNMLIPLAIGFALGRRKSVLKVFGLVAAVIMSIAVLVTYSRAGLLTLAAVGLLLVARLGRRQPVVQILVLGGAIGASIVAPGGFWNRVLTIFSGDAQAAESATNRWNLIFRSLAVAGFNPQRWLLGVGPYNFHIVSYGEQVHHNAYLQVFNEVGIIALVLYLMFLYSVLRTSNRLAREFQSAPRQRSMWIMAVTLQASLVAYAIGSAFASVAYLWYLYYVAGFTVCLRQLVEAAGDRRALPQADHHVWYLRRLQR